MFRGWKKKDDRERRYKSSRLRDRRKIMKTIHSLKVRGEEAF